MHADIAVYIAPEATIPMEAEQSPKWTSSHYDRSAPDRSLMLQLASSITGHKLKVKILLILSNYALLIILLYVHH